MSAGRQSEAARAHVWVRGDVQGVNYRAECARKARGHNLRGWVRNVADGRVEAVFEGDATAVQEMLRWCERGPAAASVDDIEVNWETATGDEPGFSVAR